MFGWFWKESLWLPANTTWENFINGPDKTVVYAEARDYWVLVPLVFVGLILRVLSERYLFKPFGRILKISDFKLKAPLNVKLEAEYRKSSTRKNATALAKQLDLPEREITRWWRLRSGENKPTTLAKFSECMWRGCHYTINVSLGLYVAWGQDWAKDMAMVTQGLPHQGVTTEMWWYYMIVSNYYVCLIITEFRDVRRKYFWPMFIHHLMTLWLLFLSWACQCFRVGCLIQILHEMSGIFLEFGKAAKYARCQTTCKNLFQVFALVWLVTRLVLFPVYILPEVYKYRNVTLVGFWIFFLLALLFVMTCFWTWLLWTIWRRSIYCGKLPDDPRSESEESEASLDNQYTNGNSQHCPQKRHDYRFIASS